MPADRPPPSPGSPHAARPFAGEETTLTAQALGDDAPALRTRPRLEWTDDTGPHSVVLADRTLVGSAAAAALVVADTAVSRLHAELDPRTDGLWVRDLGSRNGTFINGVRVTGGCVPEGGRVRLGPVGVAVHYDQAPQPIDLWPSDRFGQLIGRSTAMRELFANLALIAPTESSVLVQGETGTGKELVARAVHEASPRAARPFVIVDCAAMAENLLESELFGHARGAFTGAVAARAGAFEAAEGGTVFLDEVGELPLGMQPKLLRVLESRMVRRLGETAYRKVDVRIVSATHRDLQRMVNAGAFREDLYFRLAVLPITLPPLRERPDDIPALVEHFLPKGAGRVAGPGLAALLGARLWFGNVRELRNFVERAVALGPQRALAMTPAAPPSTPGAPAPALPAPPPAAPPAEAPAPGPAIAFDRPFKQVREEWLEHLEREYVRRLAARHQRNVAAMAQEAELDRTYIYRLIRKYEL